MTNSQINYIITQETGLVENFCEDLNAMHEAISGLPEGLQRKYMDELCDVVTNPERIRPWNWCDLDQEDWFLMFTATAKQRAEAFLRTIGKWEEEA